MLAPVVLLVYNRPEHTRQTLRALKANRLADQTHLYIFSDGPKVDATLSELEAIKKVRQVIKEISWCGKVVITERETNLGLANSVITGVTEIINKYGKTIVLEDDIVCSPHFLEFMNAGLSKYEKDDYVKQITGYFPDVINKKQNRAGFIPVTCTWSWGTWERVWSSVDFEPIDYRMLKTNVELRNSFNLGSKMDYSEMLEMQMESNKISSWGILFWWDVFKKKGLVLYPDFSLVSNIGFDGSGTHYKNVTQNSHFDIDSNYFIKIFPNNLERDNELVKSFLKQFDTKLRPSKRFLNFIKKLFK